MEDNDFWFGSLYFQGLMMADPLVILGAVEAVEFFCSWPIVASEQLFSVLLVRIPCYWGFPGIF